MRVFIPTDERIEILTLFAHWKNLPLYCTAVHGGYVVSDHRTEWFSEEYIYDWMITE
jgi:hypothetical protein